MAHQTPSKDRLALIEGKRGDWIDGSGKHCNVKEMEYPHLIALAAWLERNADSLHAQRLVRITQMEDGGIKAVADAIAEEVLTHLDTGGFPWLIGTPFYKAVESEILRREKLAVTKGRTERKRRGTDTTDTASSADLWRRAERMVPS